jgi:hypothetical protein
MIVLKIPVDRTLEHDKDWIDVPAMECTGRDQCEVALGKIQIVRFWYLWRSIRLRGNFVVDFKDGRKLEGSFKAKEIRPPQTIICE